MTEYFEDFYESHPAEQLQREVHARTGHAYYQVGDPVVDRWEREIAEGKEPDFDEALTPEQRGAEERQGERERAAAERAAGFAGLEDVFDP